MTKLFATQAIILKRRNYQELDQLITFFTKRFGKIIVRARGVRKISSKRASNLDLFNHVNIFLYKNHDFYTLTEVKLMHNFDTLKKSLNRISFGFQVAEILDSLLAQEQENIHIFEITLGILAILEDKNNCSYSDIYEYKKALLLDLGFATVDSLSYDNIDIQIQNIIEKRLQSLQFLTSLK